MLVVVIVFVDRAQLRTLEREKKDAVETFLFDVQRQIEQSVASAVRSVRQLAGKVDPSFEITDEEFAALVESSVIGPAQLFRAELAPGFVTRLVYPLNGNEGFIGQSPLRDASDGTPDLAAEVARGFPILKRVQINEDMQGELHVQAEVRRVVGPQITLVGMVMLVERFDVSATRLEADVKTGELDFLIRFRPNRGPEPEIPDLFLVEGNFEPIKQVVHYPPGDFLLFLRPVDGWHPSAVEMFEYRARFIGLAMLLLFPVLIANWFAVSHGAARSNLSKSKEQMTNLLRNLPGAALSVIIPAGKTEPSPDDKIRFLNPKSCKEIWGVDAEDVERDASIFWQRVATPQDAAR